MPAAISLHLENSFDFAKIRIMLSQAHKNRFWNSANSSFFLMSLLLTFLQILIERLKVLERK